MAGVTPCALVPPVISSKRGKGAPYEFGEEVPLCRPFIIKHRGASAWPDALLYRIAG